MTLCIKTDTPKKGMQVTMPDGRVFTVTDYNYVGCMDGTNVYACDGYFDIKPKTPPIKEAL